MLPFLWVNFQRRQMRVARQRPPANCSTMTTLQQALQNSFGKRFAITAAWARKTILTVRLAASAMSLPSLREVIAIYDESCLALGLAPTVSSTPSERGT